MKKWIRWKGLIAFSVVVALLVVFFVFFIDSIIKHSIEYAGTETVGAKVELQSAKFSFSPLGVELSKLQVTNPDTPMFNAVDIEHIAFNLDGLNLLRRKVIIDEMQVERIRINTPRQYSGAVKKKKKAKAKTKTETKTAQKKEGLAMPAFATPDMDKIFSRETLKTPQLASNFKTDIKHTEQNWKSMVQQLPDSARLNSHKQRIDKLKQVNTKDITQLTAALAELKSLKNDINNDINTINNSHKKVVTDLDRLDTELKALKRSPKDEFERLANKYNISGEGVANVSQLLFGDKAKKWTTTALEWYRKLEPYISKMQAEAKTEAEAQLERQKGVNIRFPEHNPLPDFLIKTIHASVEIPAGLFRGKINNITDEQHITGKPTTLSFNARNMDGIGSLQLIGVFNHINPEIPKDNLKFTMNDYDLNNHSLINSDELSVRLNKAKTNLHITAAREKQHIQANLNSQVHSIKYNNLARGNEMARLLLAAINDTRSFNIIAKLEGTFDDYSTRIKSDLDDRLNRNLKLHFKKQTDRFKQDLKKRIEEEARKPIAEAESEFNRARDEIKRNIEQRKRELDQQLAEIKQKSDEYKAKINSQKEKVKEKYSDKLKGMLDKFKR